MTTPEDSLPPTPPPTPPAKPPRVVKRYSNRKLYDTERSKYVTLEEIAAMIKAGEEVTIIDNKSSRDLTAVTLTQIIYEEEKRKSRVPLGMLRKLIQTGGGAIEEFFDRSVKTPVAEMKDSAQTRIEEIRQSAVTLAEAATRSVTGLTEATLRVFIKDDKGQPGERPRTTLSDAAAKRFEEAVRWYDTAFDDVVKKIEAQIKDTPNLEIKALEPILHHVTERVAELQSRLVQLLQSSDERRKTVEAEEAARSAEMKSKSEPAESSTTGPKPEGSDETDAKAEDPSKPLEEGPSSDNDNSG